jgi:class 3 adenylate cyclase
MTNTEIKILLEAAKEANKNNYFIEAKYHVNALLIELDKLTNEMNLSQNAESMSFSSNFLFREDPDRALLRADAYLLLSETECRQGNYDNALVQSQQALAISEQYQFIEHQPKSWNSIGNAYLSLSNYPRALESYTKALTTFEEINQKASAAGVLGNIGVVYRNLSDYPKALEYSTKALIAFEELGQKEEVAITMGNIGILYRILSDYPRALDYYSKALATHQELGQKSSVAAIKGNIGIVYDYLSDYARALEYYNKALTLHEELGNRAETARVMGNIGALYANINMDSYNSAKAEEYLLKAIAINEELGTKHNLYENHKEIALLYKREERWKDFASHFEQYHDLEKEVQSEEAKKQAVLIEQQKIAAEREKEIEVAKVAAQTKHQATEELLHNVLPPDIACRMLEGEKLIADKFTNVTILFADIVNFTQLSRMISAEELVVGLDTIFSSFDILAEKYGLEKIKTIGDAYMVVSGAPTPREDHAVAMVSFALDIVEVMKQFRAIATGEQIHLRIGIHCGEVVAGVIGKKKFAYDIWGDAVNTASRMESHGETGKIHVSEEFVRALGENNDLHLRFIERGEIEIKGKGKMKTYFLEL